MTTLDMYEIQTSSQKGGNNDGLPYYSADLDSRSGNVYPGSYASIKSNTHSCKVGGKSRRRRRKGRRVRKTTKKSRFNRRRRRGRRSLTRRRGSYKKRYRSRGG